MATTAQINKFISEIAPLAQKAYKELGKVLPSVAIGMACVECAYGTAGSCKHHSYFGQKVGTGKTATKYWGGKFFTSKTGEEYQVGVHTAITAAFRAYDSMEQGVYNYYELLNTSLYSGVKSGVDYKTQMSQIKACGYMTSSTEVNSVMSIISKYDLTQYDGVETAAAANSVSYSKMQFIKDIQSAVGAKMDGIAGSETLSKTITVSKTKNSKHAVVKPLQTYLNYLGYSCGTADGIAGTKFDSAVKAYQKANGCTVDGEVTAKGKIWKKLLGLA